MLAFFKPPIEPNRLFFESQTLGLGKPQVSVHPLMQHVPIRILKSRIHSGISQPINFATVVTDFTTCHNTWFHPEATRCFVPTEFCKQLAMKNGLVEGQIVQHGEHSG